MEKLPNPALGLAIMKRRTFLMLPMASLLAPLGRTDASTLEVNFKLGTVAGVYIRLDGEQLLKAVGPCEVRHEEEHFEGEPSEQFVVCFGKHEIHKHWNAFSYRDPVFKTREELGVGSPIADFEAVYGPPRTSHENGWALHFAGSEFHFAITDSKPVGGRDVATEIWVW